MSMLDFLYFSLAIGFLTTVGFVCYLVMKTVETLMEAKLVLENLRSTTGDVADAKDKLKSSTLRVIGKFLKGGSKYVPA